MTKEQANVATVVMFGMLCIGALAIYGWASWTGNRNTRRIQQTLLARAPVPSDALMKCRRNCDYAFFVDGVPIHCTGEHSGGGSRPLMHRLPTIPLTPATLVETYGKTDWCIYCKGEMPDAEV